MKKWIHICHKHCTEKQSARVVHLGKSRKQRVSMKWYQQRAKHLAVQCLNHFLSCTWKKAGLPGRNSSFFYCIIIFTTSCPFHIHISVLLAYLLTLSRHVSTNTWNRLNKEIILIHYHLPVCCLKYGGGGGLPWKCEHVLCCPIKVIVFFTFCVFG